jgi:L-iditol 2-dehydrogenase
MGHEFAGVVVATGAGVTDFHPGDRVVGEPHTRACGKCWLCRTGNMQICAQKRSPGWGIDGGFARYLVMPEKLLHAIPDNMTWEEGAMVEPAANVVQDVLERGRVEPDDFVVVTGPGPIGLLSVMAARAGGAGTIVMTGSTCDSDRLSLALEVGADHIFAFEEDDPVEAVMDLTRGRGADLVVECSGAPVAIASTVHLVRKLGRISAIGLTGRPDIAFPWDDAVKKVCTILFNMSTGYTCWDRTIGLIASGRMDVSRIISHVRPLQDWEAVFDDIENRRAIKAILVP